VPCDEQRGNHGRVLGLLVVPVVLIAMARAGGRNLTTTQRALAQWCAVLAIVPVAVYVTMGFIVAQGQQ
jgi:hypothetical protein